MIPDCRKGSTDNSGSLSACFVPLSNGINDFLLFELPEKG